MGDIIRVEKIMLLYGHLYQIDYYNETKGYHGRMFIEKEQIENAEIEDDTIWNKQVNFDSIRTGSKKT